MNYEQDTTIDPSALDVEWLEQASLMIKYVKHAAQTRLELDKAKDVLDICKAGLDKAIRADPEAFEILKLTETVILNTIIVEGEYQKVNEIYLETKYESDMAKGAVQAIEHKKSALENLVKLHGQQYFAGPSVPRDLSKEWESKTKQKTANEKVTIRRRRT